MKLSVSVPDEMWATAREGEDGGPSETVQHALSALIEKQRASRRPLAHAPDQAHLDRYRTPFDDAVQRAIKTMHEVRDHGYRLGLAIAPGLSWADFDALDDPNAAGDIQVMLLSWASPADVEVLSTEFAFHASAFLKPRDSAEGAATVALRDELLGDRDEPAPGVRWLDEGDFMLCEVSGDFAAAVVDALRDVRDEATRRMQHEDNSDEGDK